MAWFGAISPCGKAWRQEEKKERGSRNGKGKKKGRKAERRGRGSGEVRKNHQEGRGRGWERGRPKIPEMLCFFSGKDSRKGTGLVFPPQTPKSPGPHHTPA